MAKRKFPMKTNRKPPLLISLGLMAFLAILSTGETRGENLGEEWMTDYKAASEQARATGKPMLVTFSAVWCPPCRQMEKEVYPQPAVREALKAWIPVYIDVDEDPKTAAQFNISPIPTYVLVSSSGQEEDRFMGARSEKEFVARLTEHKKLFTRVREIKAALETDPSNAALWKELGDIYVKREKEDDALASYRKALEYDPEDEVGVGDDLYFYESIPETSDDLEPALEKFNGFEAKFPQSNMLDQVAFIRGMILLNLDHEDEARQVLEEGLKRYPEGPHAEDMKMILEHLEEDEV
jgi:tetratricopeptide (TPR) repeat protein